MLLVNEFQQSIINAMIADEDFLAFGTLGDSGLCVFPIAGPFVPTADLLLEGLTQAPVGFFTDQMIPLGSTTQQAVVDGAGNFGIKLDEPAGGFTFTVDNVDDGPQTIYGFGLAHFADGAPSSPLLATAMLAIPVNMTLVSQTIQMSSLLGFMVKGLTYSQLTSAIGPN